MHFTHTPLVRQLLGAVVGALSALLLYGFYEEVSPYLPQLAQGERHDDAVLHAAAPGEKWEEVIERAKKQLREER